MMQILQKWEVRVLHGTDKEPILFYIHDNHLQNVLRKVSELDFGEVELFDIRKVKQEPQQHEFDTNYEAAMEALRKRPAGSGLPNSNVRDARDSQR